MNEESSSYCYFHPREVVVGICPLCLNEKLLILASNQGRRSSSRRSYSSVRGGSTSSTTNYYNNNNNSKQQNKKTTSTTTHHHHPNIHFPKIFDFTSLLHRLEFRPWKSDFYQDDPDDHVSTSQEDDSFISIKFEENGVASWEKNKANINNSNNGNGNAVVSKVSLENCNVSSWNHSFGSNKETKTVVEHGKPRASSLRWRKRIGHLFQLSRWKRSNKGTVCHVNTKVEGVKVRNKQGWSLRTLTTKKNTTME
ncbi:hypothetical protein CsatB_008892 [Cannabis sativa]|uniref:Uncharacterized protein n=1 Tax=Cannabis sativa TaxID=3483 RepID=A0A7J6F8P7_CANSA|nr:hypothetical protein F8388_022250 [Cannabis sativa]KAF4366249.1 hypothetical protein G4B88_030427 [Cannabis sativa]